MKRMKILSAMIVLGALCLSGCAMGEGAQKEQSPPRQDPCGDGICDDLEKEKGLCPEDCPEQEQGETHDGSAEGEKAGSPVLYLGFMVHLEGWFDEVEDREKFERHMEAALELAEVFEEHGALVTFEASQETILGAGKWENTLFVLEERGHSIGVHADRGFSQRPDYSQEQFTGELRQMKQQALELGLTIEHVSGICSELDWARAAIDAGYVFTSGGVGFCAMSMPEELRPEMYQNCPSPSECHGNMPLGMEDRIHPWRINTAAGDWTQHAPGGQLVILSSDSGIKNLSESKLDPNATSHEMDYDDGDLQVVIEKVEQALELAVPDQTNQIYFSLSIGSADIKREFYNQMFLLLQPYVEAGLLEYKTLNQIYHDYLTGE